MLRRLAVAVFALLFAFAYLLPGRVAHAQENKTPEAAPAAQAAKTVVPVFRLDGPITESPTGEEIPLFSPPGTSLKDVIERMGKAARDPSIKAVVVVAESVSAGPAQCEELRQAIATIPFEQRTYL